MITATAWRTDEPCPVCGTGLILHDDGTAPPRYECRLCGWSDTWTTDQPAPADPDRDEARRAAQWLLAEYDLTVAALQAWDDGCLAPGDQEERVRRHKSHLPMFTIKDHP